MNRLQYTTLIEVVLAIEGKSTDHRINIQITCSVQTGMAINVRRVPGMIESSLRRTDCRRQRKDGNACPNLECPGLAQTATIPFPCNFFVVLAEIRLSSEAV